MSDFGESAFKGKIGSILSSMNYIADSHFGGSVELHELDYEGRPEGGPGTVILRSLNDDGEVEAEMEVRECTLLTAAGPDGLQDVEMVWCLPTDLDEPQWQLFPMIPRALMGALAF